MNRKQHAVELELEPADNKRLASLCGQFDEHIHWVEKQLNVRIDARGHHFRISGEKKQTVLAKQLLYRLYAETAHASCLSTQLIHLMLAECQTTIPDARNTLSASDGSCIKTKAGLINARSKNQSHYLNAIATHDLTFGIGPAGTGKTFLAVACAVDALEKNRVERIILVRPAVEAGERLGFLPGDLTQKIDPYCRPLYDALQEILGSARVTKLIEQHIIEVAPLAYMRGRTLNDAFVILDESQNTTCEQMKMFLTRMGYNAKVVVTGDTTQIDLPRGQQSGLVQAIALLAQVDEIALVHFEGKDVVRHQLVSKIIACYAKLRQAGDQQR